MNVLSQDTDHIFKKIERTKISSALVLTGGGSNFHLNVYLCASSE